MNVAVGVALAVGLAVAVAVAVGVGELCGAATETGNARKTVFPLLSVTVRWTE